VRLPRALRRSRAAQAGAAILGLWALAALMAPWLSAWSPTAIDFAALADPRPSAAHWLGTDATGRDMAARLFWGARTTFTVVPLAVGTAFVTGLAAGLVAGWAGGWTDAVLSRAGDVLLAFPALVLYVVLITSFGPSLWNIVVAVTLAYAPGVARLARGQVLAVRPLDYVSAARAAGEPAWRILLVEILPNIGGPLVVDLCLRAGYTVILVGTLGYLGLGLPPPTPDWGGMVVDAVNVLPLYPHMALIPAAAIVSVVVACNLLADGLREGGAE
jgi:peptide/nickel transport system permease protein